MIKQTFKIFILPMPTPGNIFLLAKLTENYTQSKVYYYPLHREPILSYFPHADACSLDCDCSAVQQCCQKIKNLDAGQALVIIGCPHSKNTTPDIINHCCPDAKLQNPIDFGQGLLVIDPESKTFDVKTAPVHLRLS